MMVYLLEVSFNEEDRTPMLYGVYSTEQKAYDAMIRIAIEQGEPALSLEHEPDTTMRATECYHQPDYSGCIFYIGKCEVE